MLVTEFGIVMLVKLEQPWNARFPMLVTEFGIVMLVNFSHDLNALLPIVLVTKLEPFHLNLSKIIILVGLPE